MGRPISVDEYQVSSGTAVQGTNGQGFVTGHDFSRADCSEMKRGFSPCCLFIQKYASVQGRNRPQKEAMLGFYGKEMACRG